MKPFYFRTSQKPLFGVYHPPQAGPARDCGIVLCYPMGDEGIRAHRAFQQLAVRLAKVGFHALRFDYYGCGDSAGDSDEGDINQWMNDILTAIDEIKDSGGLAKVSLVGLRLGATLAALVGTQRSNLESIVLWDPIVNGKGYIQELITLHQDWLRHTLPKLKQAEKKKEDNGRIEISGFPLTNIMRNGLEKINLLTIKQRPANHFLIIEDNEKDDVILLKDHLKNINVHSDYQYIPGPKTWLLRGMDGALVPSQLLQSIVSWISKVCL